MRREQIWAVFAIACIVALTMRFCDLMPEAEAQLAESTPADDTEEEKPGEVWNYACWISWSDSFPTPSTQYPWAESELRLEVCQSRKMFKIALQRRLVQTIEGQAEEILAPWATVTQAIMWRTEEKFHDLTPPVVDPDLQGPPKHPKQVIPRVIPGKAPKVGP